MVTLQLGLKLDLKVVTLQHLGVRFSAEQHFVWRFTYCEAVVDVLGAGLSHAGIR